MAGIATAVHPFASKSRRARAHRWRDICRAVGSLRLGVVVIIVLAVFMATATVFEARRGAEAAQALFYRSTWLAALMTALGVNILAATLARWPFSWRKVGFLMTHLGILVILVGAVMTNRFGLDGRLYLIEGQPAAVLSLNEAPGAPSSHRTTTGCRSRCGSNGSSARRTPARIAPRCSAARSSSRTRPQGAGTAGRSR